MKTNRTFPSKLLLFGEYSLLIGSDALAVPYRGHSGRFVQSVLGMDERLIDWLTFLKEEDQVDFLDLNEMQKDFENNIRFESDIPQGYGVGSSGALCAAVYAKYCNRPLADGQNKSDVQISILKERLSTMENYFHQNSSGIDPLVSYLDAEILLQDEMWQPILGIGGDLMCQHFFLLDAGYPRQTAPLVKNFRNMMENAVFEEEIRANFIPLVNSAIQEYLSYKVESLFNKMDKISRWQMAQFTPMIPDHMQTLFTQGLENSSFRLKICGAGGGGYFLGMSMDREQTKKELVGERIVWL